MNKSIIVLGLLALTTTSACISRASYETDPVRVPTTKGDVYCQLYDRDITWWDHSISHPSTMALEEADDICFEVGKRIKDGEAWQNIPR